MRTLIAGVLVAVMSGSALADPDPFTQRAPEGTPAPAHPAVTPPADPKPVVTVVDEGYDRRLAAKITVVSGGVLLFGALGVCLGAKGKYNDALQRHDIQEANHQVDIARYVGTPMFLVGAAAVGAGTYLYFTAKNERHTIIAPAVSGDQVGAVVSGTF